MEIELKMRQIFSDIFDYPLNDISLSSSPDNVPNWDSIGLMNFVVALEEEFKVEFEDEEIAEMLNLELVFEILKEKLL